MTYEREAAGADHEDDERLEVLVLDQPVHGKPTPSLWQLSSWAVDPVFPSVTHCRSEPVHGTAERPPAAPHQRPI